MPAVNEWIAREYFESLGFLVQQPIKYQVAARKKLPEEELDLLIINPEIPEQLFSDAILWTSKDLEKVRRAVVGVRGWHTDRFSPSLMKDSPEIFFFAEESGIKAARKVLGPGPIARILCIAELPVSKEHEAESLDILREKGIDGIILFRTLLQELVGQVDPKRNYEKSDLMQILRILKNYDLLRGKQLELFSEKKK